LGLGGRFTLSDDAHAVEHVGICYEKVQRFLKNAGIEFLHYFAPVDATAAGSEVKAISVSSLGDNPLMTVSLD
jgi:histidinol-phosphatase (PHP family)